MGQARKITVGIFVAIAMYPWIVTAAQEEYEIDLKELRPARGKANLKQDPQPSTHPSLEIDLKELRKIAPPLPAKSLRRPGHTSAAAPPEATAAGTSGDESSHVVQPGEYLFQILMTKYGLSNSAAERLIPEVMRLNGITSPKGLKVGQRLRIPLPATGGKRGGSPPATGEKPDHTTAETAPAMVPVPPASTATPAEADSITIIPAPPCKLAHEMSEKMGLLAPSQSDMLGMETVSTEYAGRSVTIVCGLSGAEQYTCERLLTLSGKQLLTFDSTESAEHVVEKLANILGLAFHKHEQGSGIYIFAPFGARSHELQLTILPDPSPPAPPAIGAP